MQKMQRNKRAQFLLNKERNCYMENLEIQTHDTSKMGLNAVDKKDILLLKIEL